MAYIGRDTDKISNVEVLDNITFDGSSSYTLQKGGSNFTPSSANTLLLSIDGVVQAGNFTVSGSTIDFGTAVAGTSTCDFILHYGVGLITAPSDGTVTTAKLADSSVSLAKLTATGTKDATTFLRGDNTFAEVPAGGITEMDMYRLTANITSDSDITSNLERVDTFNFSKIGTGMTESSGVFSFPSTGVYEVTIQARVNNNSGTTDRIQINTKISSDGGSNYSTIDGCDNAVDGSSAGGSATFQQTNFINVTTSNFRVRFTASSLSSGSAITGDTTHNRTAFIFKRLGDSQ